MGDLRARWVFVSALELREVTRSIEVFLRGVLPPRVLSPNRGERKEGRAAFAISGRSKR